MIVLKSSGFRKKSGFSTESWFRKERGICRKGSGNRKVSVFLNIVGLEKGVGL